MAGIYNDAPSRRFGLDADGTIMYYVPTLFNEPLTELSQASKAITNSENESYVGVLDATNQRIYVGVLFPEDREIDGMFYAYHPASATYGRPSDAATSVDSTNGIDGTWVQQVADLPDYTVCAVNFRNGITSLAVATVKALRVRLIAHDIYDSYVKSMHLYGTISPGETPDRILFLDTLNSDAEFTKPIDYGEIPRGQTQTRTIKLKNNSSTKTINTIQMTAEALYLNAGGFYTFSTDDVSYQATLALGNLGPGATTPALYMKQSVPDAETLGLQTARLRVSHASLT